MKSKPFLIAIAAFAVTATGVQAFQGTEILQKAGLNEEQIEAFESARELRESGDLKAARDALIQAGVDEETMKSIHRAMHGKRNDIRDAVEAGDYEAFKVAVAGTPLEESVQTEEDFQTFIQAHNLKAEGKWEEAKPLFDELGLEAPVMRHGRGHGMGMMGSPDFLQELTDDQREAIEVAKEANDKEAVRAILEEAGIDGPHHKMRHW